MTFEEWFNEIEVFSLRGERFYDEVEHYKEGSGTDIVRWLKAAWQVGYDHRNEELMDDGK